MRWIRFLCKSLLMTFFISLWSSIITLSALLFLVQFVLQQWQIQVSLAQLLNHPPWLAQKTNKASTNKPRDKVVQVPPAPPAVEVMTTPPQSTKSKQKQASKQEQIPDEQVRTPKDVNPKEQLVYSVEDIRAFKKKLSDDERMTMMALVIPRVPPADLQRLSGWLEEGVTTSEMRQMDQLMRRYFTPDERQQIFAILQ